ncbi:MAG: aldose epimerase family protein [Planctomycetaceae bacterium]
MIRSLGFCGLLSLLALFGTGCELKSSSPPDPGPTLTSELNSELNSEPNPSSTEADMNSSARVVRERLNDEADGKQLEQFVLTNKNGLRAVVLNLGGILASVETPDRNGKLANIVCGFSPDNERFLKNPPYFGAICGRYSNRIGQGKFTLDGTEHTLATNNGANHLHGGAKGFDKYIWDAETVQGEGWAGVKLTHISPDGDEGYPGTLTSVVTYKLTDKNELRIEYSATTDKATPLNLTNHAYWNLKGARPESGTVLDHIMHLNCDSYVAVDDESIPTGKLTAVKDDAPMDFTKAKPIGQDLGKLTNDPQGYDHCWVINGGGDSTKDPVLAAEVREASTGRVMRVLTTEPGVQFYTGNYLPGTPDVNGFAKHGGFCLETQKFPDSPNQLSFPSCILKPGETYQQVTVHEFGIE